jgi:subtilisin family serine protease
MLILTLLINLAFGQEIIAIPNHGCPKAIGRFIFSKQERLFVSKFSPEIACSQKVSKRVDSQLYHFEENPVLHFHALQKKLKNKSDNYHDIYKDEQWGLKNLGFPQPFIIDDITSFNIPGEFGEDIGVSGFDQLNLEQKEITVAVLDTGIDLNHPDLKNQIVSKKSECDALEEYKNCIKSNSPKICDSKFATIDTDQNGYPMDCHGWNVTGKVNQATKIMGDSDVQDKIGHGTHVAGIIAAEKNGFGIEGVAPKAKILPVKVLSSAPSSPERPLSIGGIPGNKETELPKIKTYGDVFARGLLYAIRSGANVVNMSLGWPYAVDSELMRTLVKIALDQKILLVSSAGNDSTSVPLFPCNYTGVICVGSHGADGAFSTFSNYGTNVDLVAPGSRILSTYPMNLRPSLFNEANGYEFDQGTSMSSPFVAGVIARLLAVGIPTDEIYPRLISSARSTKVSSNSKLNLYDKFSLSGNIDLLKSYQALPVPVILPAEKGQKLKLINPNLDLNFKIKLKNFWVSSNNILVDVFIQNKLTKDSVKLEPFQQLFETWEQNEIKLIELKASLVSLMSHSDLEFVVKVSRNNITLNQFVYQLELVSDLLTHPHVVEFPVSNQTSLDLNQTRFRSLRNNQILILKDSTIQKENQEDFEITHLALMTKTHEGYLILKNGFVPRLEGELQDIQTIGNQLILTLKTKNEEGKPKINFLFVDDSLHLVRTLSVDSAKAPLSSDIIWIKDVNRFNPLWIAFGTNLANKPFDPWNPKTENEQGLWFYTLDERGIRNVDFNFNNRFLVTILPQNQSDLELGSFSVLLAKGDKYDFEFSLVKISNGKIISDNLLNFSHYHMLAGLNATPFNSQLSSGLFFDSEKLITEILDGQFPTVKQFKIKPVNNLLQIQKVHGVFHTDSFEGAFSQTQNELQYHDFKTDKVSYTTLKRFSFMPNYFFDKFFYPLTIKDRPALYIPSGLGTSFSSDMVIPDTTGGALILKRPALWRIFSKGECRELNPVDDNGVMKLRYFCGTKILEINLNAGLVEI